MPVIKCVGNLGLLSIGALSLAALLLGVLAVKFVPKLAGVYAEVSEISPYTLVFSERLEGGGQARLATQVLAVRGNGSIAKIRRTEWAGQPETVPGGVFETHRSFTWFRNVASACFLF